MSRLSLSDYWMTPHSVLFLGAHDCRYRFHKVELKVLSGTGKVIHSAPPLAIAPFDAANAKQHQEAWADRLGLPVELTNSVGMKLRLIPPGEFRMGKRPGRRVRITKPFYLGVYEVTQAEYERVMKGNSNKFKSATYPVERVSWNDAVEFCKNLSAKEGKTYRLPTEAEWEYACRAGTTTLYSSGDDKESLGEYAWYRDNSGGKPHPVGEKKPNAWGLHDMHGNVWEWCADWWAKDYYADSPTDDPPGPETGSFRVYRGGSWVNLAGSCRSANRFRSVPSDRRDFLGFRVAVSSVGVSK